MGFRCSSESAAGLTPGRLNGARKLPGENAQAAALPQFVGSGIAVAVLGRVWQSGCNRPYWFESSGRLHASVLARSAFRLPCARQIRARFPFLQPFVSIRVNVDAIASTPVF